MKRFQAAIERHPYITAVTATGLLILGTTEGMGWAQNPTHALPARYCGSPFTSSEPFFEPSTTAIQAQTGFFTTGVVAKGHLPADAYGIRVSLRAPDEKGHPHLSKMIVPDRLGNVAAKVAVADRPIQVEAQVIAPEGSAACNAVPNINFRHEDVVGYFFANANLLFPTPVSVIPSVAGIVDP